MFRRSSVIIAASLVVLSTFEPVLCFAAAAPAQPREEEEKPRYLKKEVKRFVWDNNTSSQDGNRPAFWPRPSPSSLEDLLSSSVSLPPDIAASATSSISSASSVSSASLASSALSASLAPPVSTPSSSSKHPEIVQNIQNLEQTESSRPSVMSTPPESQASLSHSPTIPITFTASTTPSESSTPQHTSASAALSSPSSESAPSSTTTDILDSLSNLGGSSLPQTTPSSKASVVALSSHHLSQVADSSSLLSAVIPPSTTAPSLPNENSHTDAHLSSPAPSSPGHLTSTSGGQVEPTAGLPSGHASERPSDHESQQSRPSIPGVKSLSSLLPIGPEASSQASDSAASSHHSGEDSSSAPFGAVSHKPSNAQATPFQHSEQHSASPTTEGFPQSQSTGEQDTPHSTESMPLSQSTEDHNAPQSTHGDTQSQSNGEGRAPSSAKEQNTPPSTGGVPQIQSTGKGGVSQPAASKSGKASHVASSTPALPVPASQSGHVITPASSRIGGQSDISQGSEDVQSSNGGTFASTPSETDNFPAISSQRNPAETFGPAKSRPFELSPSNSAQPASSPGHVIAPATVSHGAVTAGASKSVQPSASIDTHPGQSPLTGSSFIAALSHALQTATTLSNGAVVPVTALTDSHQSVPLVPVSTLNSAGSLVPNSAILSVGGESRTNLGASPPTASMTLSNGDVVGVTPVTNSRGGVTNVPISTLNSAGDLAPNSLPSITKIGFGPSNIPVLTGPQSVSGSVQPLLSATLSSGQIVPLIPVTNSDGSVTNLPASTLNSAGSFVPNSQISTANGGGSLGSIQSVAPVLSELQSTTLSGGQVVPVTPVTNTAGSVTTVPLSTLNSAGNLVSNSILSTPPSATLVQSGADVSGTQQLSGIPPSMTFSGAEPSPSHKFGEKQNDISAFASIPASVTNSNGELIKNPSNTAFRMSPSQGQDQGSQTQISGGSGMASATISNGPDASITSAPSQGSLGSHQVNASEGKESGQSVSALPVTSGGVTAGQASTVAQSKEQGTQSPGAPASVSPVTPIDFPSGKMSGSAPPPIMTAGPVASGSQSYPSNGKGPFTQEPTAWDSATQLGVQSSILFTSALPPSQASSGPTGLPTGVPLVLYPPTGPVERPPNTDLIQVGFLYPLNYEFVYTHDESQRQIFKYLPMGICYGLDIGIENVTMQTLRAWDTTKDLHYITTLALVWIPKGLVDSLGDILHTQSAKFYHNPNPSVQTLLGMINPALPIRADAQTDGNSPPGFGQTPNNDNMDGNGAPIGGGLGNNSPVKASSVGIGVGVCVGAAAYGAAMFFVARRYKKKRQSHLRSPSMYSSPVMSHVGPDPAAGAALMSGAMGERSLSPYHDDDGRGSRGSGRSGSSGRQQISAPVMAENSLGWN